MSRLHDPEDAVSMRLLGDASANDDGDQWAARGGADPRLPFTSRTPSPGRRRVLLLRAFCGILLFTITALVVVASRKPIIQKVQSWHTSVASALAGGEPATLAIQDHSLYVAGAPALRFRDNLVNGTKYVTAWPIGGFSNQVMAQINLVYLALLALRIPVIADFVPGHMHGNPGHLPVSEVYDLPRLAASLRIPVLEWAELKNRSPQHETEFLGCWSPHATIFKDPGHYSSELEFGLDVSLTPVPDSRSQGVHENMQSIMALASLGWPEQRARALQHATPLPSLANRKVLPPDETMLCFDELYYANSVKAYEWYEQWVPMWTQVGKHMRWEPKMEALARSFIMRAFGLRTTDPFPSYIGVHIRHTDFATLCHEHSEGDCFQPLSVYGAKIAEVRAELLAQRGEHVDSVLVTSDELDPEWWASVRAQGWHRIDWEAERTEEIYSEWYPIVLDSVALSLGKGFVGTERSTLSLLAAKRVRDWEDGFVRVVALNK